MKKTLVIIVAVAILGVLGLFANSKKTESPSSSEQAGVSSAATTSSNGSTTQDASQESTSGTYKDGNYTKSADTPYGPVKITVVINSGKISDVSFDDMPNDEDRSQELSNSSGPVLKQRAIAAQSAKIDFVSGATNTSYGFQESLQAALDAAMS